MITVDNLLPAGFRESSLRSDVLTGLSATPKWLPPKWFYDAEGSALFEKITELPEYYPTRAERAILRAASGEIAAASRAETLVELGSGSSEKTRLLLDALRQAGTLRRYVPVDVSESALRAAGSTVAAEYPGLDVHAVMADFDAYLGPGASGDGAGPGDGSGPRRTVPGGRPPHSALPGDIPRTPGPPGHKLVAFLGSTIGNMLPEERAAFLSRVRSTLRSGDAFLLGTDLVKDPSVLVAAYDDSAGVTAAFNKNVLSVLNASLGADFDLDAFDHVAVWDPRAEWIEMRLRSTAPQEVRVPGVGLTVPFGAGEEMRTEVSAKFRRARVAAELAAAGLELRSWWTDDAAQFGLSLSVPA